MKPIVVVGGGGHARVVIGVLKKQRKYPILGYTDPEDKGSILGVRYLGGDEVLKSLAQARPGCCAVIGVGSVRADRKRERIWTRLRGLGLDLPAVASPQAIVNEDVSLGEGTVVLDGAVVNPGTRIGAGVIINTNSTVEHDCRIGDFVHIASGATLSGGVSVGRYSLVGTGASVLQFLKIGEGCTIGAGTAVVSDCLRPGVYVGVPASLKR